MLWPLGECFFPHHFLVSARVFKFGLTYILLIKKSSLCHWHEASMGLATWANLGNIRGWQPEFCVTL